MRQAYFFTFIAIIGLLSGCANFCNLQSSDRLSRGHVLVLSGIETPSVFTGNIARGIAESGWQGGIEIHDWTTGRFILFPKHLMDIETNRQQARELAEKIINYQDEYPGAPLHLIGHSGGTGIIVMALENLPDDRQVTTATLLASALSPTHDLSTAISKTERGLWSYYSPGDFVLCGLGTSLLGTIDREYRPAAALVGFKRPVGLNSRDEFLYQNQFHQVRYNLGMIADGNFGEHFGWTTKKFVRKRIAPAIISNSNLN